MYILLFQINSFNTFSLKKKEKTKFQTKLASLESDYDEIKVSYSIEFDLYTLFFIEKTRNIKDGIYTWNENISS